MLSLVIISCSAPTVELLSSWANVMVKLLFMLSLSNVVKLVLPGNKLQPKSAVPQFVGLTESQNHEFSMRNLLQPKSS